MATPFVAGTAALMLDANPSLTPASIKSDLMSTAQDWGPTGADIDYGAGREQGYDAVKLAFWQAGHDTAGYVGPADAPHIYRADKLGGKGKTDIWRLTITSRYGWFNVTMIMPDWKSKANPDFQLCLYDPWGKQLTCTCTQTRQDFLTYFFRPSKDSAGYYQLHVTSKAGSGDYFFDLSHPDAASIIKIQDQLGPQGEPAPLAGSEAPLKTEPAAFRNGAVRLGFELAQPGPVRMAVYDGTGRMVAVSTADALSGRNEMTVGLPQVSEGVYFYRLETGAASVVGKFAVIR